MKSNIVTITKAIVLGLVLSIGVGYISAAWSNPPVGGTPPACNDLSIPGCNPPINVGSNLQTKTGSIVVDGLSTVVFKLADGTQGDGKVLISDANGFGTWQDTSAGGSSSGPYCNVVNTALPYHPSALTGPAVIDNYKVSLLKDGVNMCSDANNCTFNLWAATDEYPQGRYFFGKSPIAYRQISPSGNWIESTRDDRGVNGNNVNTLIAPDTGEWHGGFIADDGGSVEADKDHWTFTDNTANYSFVLRVCDF